MTTRPTIHVRATTHVGMVRTINQDCLHVAGWSSSLSGTQIAMPVPPRSVVAVIDGMGGQPGGDCASWTASRALGDARLERSATATDIGAKIQWVSDVVRTVGQSTQGYSRMGATIAGVAFTDAGMILFNVGDCSILQIDRTGVSQLAEIDRIGAHSVGQCLGGTEKPTAIDAHPIVFQPREREQLLLSTDGLTDCLTLDQIGQIIAGAGESDPLSELVRAACAAGAPDNISLALVTVAYVPPDGSRTDD